MSAAESDLLFPQLDSLILADFSSLSDYEDFSRDAFLLNDVDGFALADDFDCKSALKPLLVTELNEFGTSLAGIKEEDEEEEKAGSLATCCTHADDTQQREQHLAVPTPGNASSNENMHVDSVSNEQKTQLTSNGDSCMSLEDAIIESSNGLWQSSPFKRVPSIVSDFSDSSLTMDDSNSPFTLSVPGDTQFCQMNDVSVTEMSSSAPLPCTQSSPPIQCSLITAASNGRSVERRPARTPSVFKINSPLSSPTSSVTTPDRCSIFKVMAQDENGRMYQASASKGLQPAFVDAGTLSLRGDVYHKPLSQSIMQDGRPFTSMHRSQSSHSLGQFRLSGQHGTYPEERHVSPIHVPAMGYACSNNFTPYSPPCSFGLAEKSSTMPMRRVFSTGDIQASHGMQSFYGENSSSHMERGNSEENMALKVGHYTLEERKLRVHRYRQKRNERNFSKKIKYACRKTLADSRPRIRGRFARMLDDSGEPLVKDNEDDYEEVGMPILHCGVPHGHMGSFLKTTGFNAAIQHGH